MSRSRSILWLSGALLIGAHNLGCLIPHGHCIGFLMIDGELINADDGLPIAGAFLGGRAFLDGMEIGDVPAVIFDGGPNGPPSEVDGSFRLEFSTNLGGCHPPLVFPPPDQIEIIVYRDGCEQRFLIDINEETVVDITFPGDVIELRNPILVPSCDSP